MKFLGAYFSFHGRLNRAQYAAIFATSYIPGWAIIFSTEAAVHRGGDLYAVGALALMAAMLWIGFAAMARRFRDIGKTGWASLLVFIPLVGQLTPLVLLAYPGDEGPNEFGSPQRLL